MKLDDKIAWLWFIMVLVGSGLFVLSSIPSLHGFITGGPFVVGGAFGLLIGFSIGKRGGFR